MRLAHRVFRRFRPAFVAPLALFERSTAAMAGAATFACLLLLAACGGDGVTSARDGSALRLSIAPTIMAGPGAVVEAILSYAATRSASIVTLARDTLVIPTTAGPDVALSLAANVTPCLEEAAATGASCSVTLTLRLKRDGALLDESVQQFPVTSSTLTVAVPAINLYEVSTVTIAPATLAGFEPGDSRTLTVAAVDRTGAAVTPRMVTWQVVSGGVTVSAAGQVTAVATGPARVRATVGGRSSDLAFDVGPVTVATIGIAPADTLISVGASAVLRPSVMSTTGQVLTGRVLTFTSSNPAVATVNASGLIVGVSIGTSTITVRSTEGRAGAVVTASTTVRVEAPPPLLVDRANVALDDVIQGSIGALTTVLVTTTAGKQVSGLLLAVTYAPNVTPWLGVSSFTSTSTPTLLRLQANPGSLAPGDYSADVLLYSIVSLYQPATVHVTLRVVAARKVTLAPKTVNFGTLSSSQTTAPGVNVTVGSSTSTAITGLGARIEYISGATGWFTAVLSSQTAAPTTTLTLTPQPSGLATGAYQARVIVSSTAFGVSPDTVNVALTIALTGRFTGLVLNNSTNQPIAGASVSIRRASDNVVVDGVTTAADGRFTSNLLPGGSYILTFSATGFVASTLFDENLTASISSPLNTLPTALLAPVGTGSGIIQGSVRDATTNAAVVNATVELRAGGNNTTGTVLASTVTARTGTYSFAAQAAGTYTIRVLVTGYAPTSVTVTVSGFAVTAPVLFVSPGTGNSVYRFVLSWGSAPADLDAHLTGPITGSTNRFHVYFNAKGSATSSPFATLDVDQLNGNGPETITIAQQFPGTYRYYVANFSGEIPLSLSNARVDVYLGNALINQFFVPAQNGAYWTVFELTDNTVTPINTIGNAQPSIVIGGASASAVGGTPASRASAEWLSLFPELWTKPASTRRP